MMFWLKVGAALAIAAAIAWSWNHYVRMPYITDGRALEAEAQALAIETIFGVGTRTPEAVKEILDGQSKAIRDLERDSKRRLAVAQAALKKAQEGNAVLAAKVQSLLAEQPSAPESPCASACSLLQQPL